MSRTFKVGDIVDGRDKSGSKMAKSKPIERIVDNVFYDVGGCFYISMYLTLITPVEALSNNRGVEQYKDQFTPWNKEALRDSNPLIRDLANEISIMPEQ